MERTFSYNPHMAEELRCRIKTIPLCFGSLIWDFADTVCDQLRFLKDPSFKSLSRELKARSEAFDRYYKDLGLTDAEMAPLLAYREGYINDPKGVGAVYNAIFNILSRKYPDMPIGYRMLYTVIWQIMVFAKTLCGFDNVTGAKVGRMMGVLAWTSSKSFVSQEILTLPKFLKPYLAKAEIGEMAEREIISALSEELRDISGHAAEPTERSAHRRRCIAFICNRGCRAGAIGKEKFGCYPAASCKWMQRYDKKHDSL